ncbi:MAG: hypothetical protein FWC20_04410 [Oscillospiraceae bacterium]|nr:hypothetical protein [Oscillospiraceae bacterium]MCL2278635.1 hypothetical protein [Oscillospiraceae bacterium]
MLSDIITGAFNIYNWIVSAAGVVLTNDGAWDMVFSLSQSVIYPVALTIAVICLLYEVSQTAMKVDTITWETGVRLMVLMAIVRISLHWVPRMLRAMWSTAVGFINNLTVADNNPLGNADAIIQYIDGLRLPARMIATVPVLVVSFAIIIAGLAILFIAYGRLFEILIYVFVAPLPIAFLALGSFNGGINRITGKFLRLFAAACLHGAIMLVCIQIFGAIAGNIVDVSVGGGVFWTLLQSAFVALIMLGAVIKSGSWAKSVLDA